jgi:hypothetical protein
MHLSPDIIEILLVAQAVGRIWHKEQGSGEASVLPTASVVEVLLLPLLVLIAVVDSRCRCHGCRGNCRDDPFLVELLVRILLLL